jgi:hypothetical protein
MHLIHHRGRRIASQVFEALAPKETVFGQHGAPNGRYIAPLNRVFADSRRAARPI